MPSGASVAQWIDGAFAYGFTFLPSLVQRGSGWLWGRVGKFYIYPDKVPSTRNFQATYDLQGCLHDKRKNYAKYPLPNSFMRELRFGNQNFGHKFLTLDSVWKMVILLILVGLWRIGELSYYKGHFWSEYLLINSFIYIYVFSFSHLISWTGSFYIAKNTL